MGTWSTTGPSGVTWSGETNSGTAQTANYKVFVKATIVRIPGNQIVIRCICRSQALKTVPGTQDGFSFGISGEESSTSGAFSIGAEGDVKTLYYTSADIPDVGDIFYVFMRTPGGGSSDATAKTAPAMLTPPVKVMRSGSLVTAKNVWVMRSGSLVAAKDIHKG